MRDERGRTDKGAEPQRRIYRVKRTNKKDHHDEVDAKKRNHAKSYLIRGYYSEGDDTGAGSRRHSILFSKSTTD